VGCTFLTSENIFHIKTKDSTIIPRILQLEGKNPCEINAFLRGYPEFKATKLS